MSTTMSSCNVDFLFETQSIEQIRDACRKIDTDIQRKNLELKDIVSQRYKDVIEAVDIVQDMQSLCSKYEKSLGELEIYLSQGDKTKVVVTESNRGNDLAMGHKLASVLSVIPYMYRCIESADFMSCSKQYEQSVATLTQIRNQECLPRQVVVECEKNLSRVRSFVAMSVVYELEKLPQNQNLVITALSSLVIVCGQSAIQCFENMLMSVGSVIQKNLIPSTYSLSHALITFSNCMYFVFMTTNDIFQNNQPLTLPSYVSRMFNIKVSKEQLVLDDEEIRGRLAVWCKQQETLLSNAMPGLLQSQNLSDLLNSLQSLSESSTSSMRSDWDLASRTLLNRKKCLWKDCLRDQIMQQFHKLVCSAVDECVSCLTLSGIRDSNFSVSSFVWSNHQSDSSLMLQLKRSALVPELKTVFETFETNASNVLKSLQILSGGVNKLTLVDEEDIKSMQATAADRFDLKLENFVNQLAQSAKSQFSKCLPASFLVRSLVLMESDLKMIYNLNPESGRWVERREKLLKQSYIWLSLHYHRSIEKFSVPLLKLTDISLDQLTESSLPWQEIVLKGEVENDAQPVIRVPVYPSVPYMEFLTSISREVNQTSGHGLPDQVCIAILQKTTMEIMRVYTETLSRVKASKLPSSMLQRKSLQCYFDLLISRAIVTPIRDEKIRSTLMPKLTSLIKSFEENLDPFDLHLMSKTIQQHVGTAIRNCNHIFCLFVPEAALESLKKSYDSKTVPPVSNDSIRVKTNCHPLQLLPISK